MPIARLILVPALITLVVTLLRLVGELQGWSPLLFKATPGGFGALVGIAWLVPIFGIYFAIKLARAGYRPASLGKTILYILLAVVLCFAIGSIGQTAGWPFRGQIITFAAGSIVALAVAMRGWPALGRTLLAYGVAARLPVIIIMVFAIRGDWGTHYDAPAPDVPPMGVWGEFVWTGLIPQLSFWLSYTVLIGGLFGTIAAALAGRRKQATASA